ncbi:MAG: hypothetical protein RBG13Loki_2695 [Promethearchaeota archaeon CR_4]|nr:MAG: hypothetical protein RBG13Loki_2695 [Candidatus Lokiarchaeota archaeon CR_4]
MDSKITLVSLDIEDYEEVTALWTRAGLKFRPEGRDSHSELNRQLASKFVWLIGTKQGEILIGVVMPSHDSRRGWINRLAIDPAFRRQGIGVALIQEAMKQLRARGIDVIAATIESDNAASLALVRKVGFQVAEDVFYASHRTSQVV